MIVIIYGFFHHSWKRFFFTKCLCLFCPLCREWPTCLTHIQIPLVFSVSDLFHCKGTCNINRSHRNNLVRYSKGSQFLHGANRVSSQVESGFFTTKIKDQRTDTLLDSWLFLRQIKDNIPEWEILVHLNIAHKLRNVSQKTELLDYYMHLWKSTIPAYRFSTCDIS